MDHFRKALDMGREFYGEKHPLVAGIMNDMGALYTRQGDYAAAVDYFRKVLEIRKEVLGECHPDVLMSYNPEGSPGRVSSGRAYELL